MTTDAIRSTTILANDEPFPVDASNLGASSPWLVVCDHAGRRTPRVLDRLGLAPAAFDTHIAWDIGAGALSKRLAEALGSSLIRQRYSRLVIDCNRSPDRADLILERSDGTVIPGNLKISAAERLARLSDIHAPYHDVIAREIDERLARMAPPILLLLHSFTPCLGGFERPWRFGVLHMGDSALSGIAIDELRREDDAVGDNQPYVMDEIDYTAPRHAITRGLEYLELEVRQDLLADDAGAAQVADFLARVLPRCLARLPR